MNCSECISGRVCKLQEEIRLLAYKMVTTPFYRDNNMEAVGRMQEKRTIRREEIHYKLKGIIGSHCPLYLQKDQDLDGESSSTG